MGCEGDPTTHWATALGHPRKVPARAPHWSSTRGARTGQNREVSAAALRAWAGRSRWLWPSSRCLGEGQRGLFAPGRAEVCREERCTPHKLGTLSHPCAQVFQPPPPNPVPGAWQRLSPQTVVWGPGPDGEGGAGDASVLPACAPLPLKGQSVCQGSFTVSPTHTQHPVGDRALPPPTCSREPGLQTELAGLGPETAGSALQLPGPLRPRRFTGLPQCPWRWALCSPFLQTRRWTHREVKPPAQGHTASSRIPTQATCPWGCTLASSQPRASVSQGWPVPLMGPCPGGTSWSALRETAWATQA